MLTRRTRQPEPKDLIGAQRARFEIHALPHLDALYGTALRLTQNERDAEDLVQDAVLRAYQSFEQFQGDDRCKPWLFKILTNTFINKYRRRMLERQVAQAMAQEGTPEMLSDSTVHAAQDPERSLRAGLFSDDVRAALQALPEEFRLAVLLCDIEEFSYKEIADILDCPVGTVMSRLYRGRRLLQEALRGYAREEGILRQEAAPSQGEVISIARAHRASKNTGEGGK
jgi:RNA polymerase sigma-70 factor (ECF subfamily)